MSTVLVERVAEVMSIMYANVCSKPDSQRITEIYEFALVIAAFEIVIFGNHVTAQRPV